MVDMESKELKQTPLYEYYQEKGLKLIDFGGWALPVQFTKIAEEHEAVRTHAGIFEVSHMGEIVVKGKEATRWLNQLVTNDVSKMTINQAQYNTMTNEQGGTLDDLLLFKFSDDHYLVTPNAGNTDKIYKWMIAHAESTVKIENVSDDYGLIALQGPKSERILKSITQTDLASLNTYHFLPAEHFSEIKDVIVARTGYTGEDGFELYVKKNETQALWEKLVRAGFMHGLKECGLGARDTLRLEAGMALYGQELTEEITPLEGGVGFAVKVDKTEPFIGQAVLQSEKIKGSKRVSRGFELLEKGIARHTYPVFNQNQKEIGVVTSGTQSPSLGKSIGMMLIDKAESQLGETVLIKVRTKQIPAKLTKKDWLKSIHKN
ncbi:glycine cleavage system aminomethyltransferase GcvT [Marinilactibacillus kalidii]|uniref:glycine cleavage system aminomethyltransferase GcvT n=1 Tax=Marinilactibacillus kalidii TaxID=2820274 RepID=UPI001FC93EAC|nr:glycine cleavage system aminomethyltransferase GcvT [Marinilactibacillus kalidii]